MSLNNVWKHYNENYQAVYPIVRSKILPGVTSNWSFVMVKNQSVIGCCINYDIVDYINNP
jgi:hypothetical protein